MRLLWQCVLTLTFSAVFLVGPAVAPVGFHTIYTESVGDTEHGPVHAFWKWKVLSREVDSLTCSFISEDLLRELHTLVHWE